jgi:predicted amidohydrolase
MKVKIAVVQFEIKQFSPKENLERAGMFVKDAAYSKADIIVFPEDFLTGPIIGKREYADRDNEYLRFFQRAAKKNGIDIVPGSIIEEENGSLYNVAYYISSNGKVKAKYRKINLWLPERKYLTPGNELSVFNTKYGKIGLAICWDLAFPEMFRKMTLRGARIVICPSYWAQGDAGIGLKYDRASEVKFVNSVCASRAFENCIALVYCNPAGELHVKKGRRFINEALIGNSQVTIPFRGCIKRLDHNKEEMFIEEIDTAILSDAERSYKIRKDLKSRVLS